jgi:hypothetical protein
MPVNNLKQKEEMKSEIAKRIGKLALDCLALLMVLVATIEAVVLVLYNPGQLLLAVIVSMIVLALRWAVVRVFRHFRTDDEEGEIRPVNSKARAIRTIGGVCCLLLALVVAMPKHQAEAQYYSTYNYGGTYYDNNNTTFNNQNVGGMESFGYQTMGQMIWSMMKDPFNWSYGAGNISKMFDRSEDPGHAFWKSGSGRMPVVYP